MGTGLEWIGYAASAASAAAGVYSATQAGKNNKPEVPVKPQAAVEPDRKATDDAAAMAAGMKQGNKGTFLTGASGVDPGSLNLGKTTLLGG